MLSVGKRFGAAHGLASRLLAPGFGALIDRVDRGLVRGTMVAHLPDGTARTLGGRAPGFEVELTVKDWRALVRLATGGSIGWYQAWEKGEWACEDLVSLFAIMGANARELGNTARPSGPFKWAARIVHGSNRNSRAGSARNVAAHYDLGNDFYAAWLDSGMTYSSALGWGDGGLEAAQARKLTAIAARLGEARSVLEIGCGWGSLAQLLAAEGREVTAISLSEEQLAYARANRLPAIRFEQRDYRTVEGQYDAIACVEMVEALGREYWPAFLDCIARSLKPGGRAALQYISMAEDLFETYAGTTDFIQAYVFPGGLLIKSSEFRALAEARGLAWEEPHAFGEDYAHTLAEWRARFEAAVREGLLPEGFDTRFQRLWRYYLSYCEGGFRSGNVNVHQVTLVRR
ncbi:MAG: cyclopropane-fatty-acyl-phospholipid synthase family protein [Erythrobacter sp.]|nr:cyclopropane-fatty-acyl-phospholipid synthase family protein [Erythrobacter sp.]